MASVKVAKSSGTSKATQVAGGESASPNLVAMAAQVWGFAAKVAEEQFTRDDLVDGSHGAVELSLIAKIDGRLFTHHCSGSIDVGHSSVRATSVGAKAGEIVAYLLSKVNAATREATLREMAEVYAANGCKLPVSEAAIEEAETAMQALRQKKEQSVRGTVRVSSQPAASGLSIVG